jgi:hypothetical protein
VTGALSNTPSDSWRKQAGWTNETKNAEYRSGHSGIVEEKMLGVVLETLYRKDLLGLNKREINLIYISSLSQLSWST